MLGIKLVFCRLLPIAPVVLFAGFSAFAEDTTSAPEVVWVKADKAAFESEGVIGDGTEANPFNTIQKGVDTVAVGGTVKIMAGTYDYDEQFDGTHTNRVIISKRVILDGVEGKDMTHIVGKLAAGKVGNGPDAIRCIKITEGGKESFIKNVTIRNGGAASDDANYIRTWGGGVCGYSIASRDKIYVVDCVISNCGASMGGALQSAYAIRCKINQCRTSSWGVAARYACLYHCLITNCRNYNTSNRPVVALSYAVNCTLVNCTGPTQGFGRSSYIYNCISWGNGAADIVEGESQYNVSAKEDCYTDQDCSDPFIAQDKGDYRLVKEASIIGKGKLEHFSKIAIPDGVDKYVDLAGNNIDLTKGICDIGCYQRIFDWYVDAENGDDGNSGCKADAAKKTLTAIMNQTLSGDTVHAAGGTYNENASKTPLGGKARVVVPQGVTLIAEDGAKNTFIVGAPDETESGDEYGFGTNAVRCVYLLENSKIKGFTITGGYTWSGVFPAGYENTNKDGGGIRGATLDATVDSCIVSNNWSYRYGGGMAYATAIHSCFFENRSLEQGGAVFDAKIYGCVVDKNYTGFSTTTRPASCFCHRAIVGCTIGENTYTLDGGENGLAINSERAKAVFQYSFVLGSLGMYSEVGLKVIDCIFKKGVASWSDKLENCIVKAGDAIKLDENYRPLPDSIGVDWVTVEQLSSASGGKQPVDKDLSGFQRVMNGKIDVGALEADWRGEYAKLLDGAGKRIVVNSASSGIVTNDVSGAASLSLHNGEALEFVWWSDMPKAKRKGTVSVTGDGTLTLKRNGVEYAAFDSYSSPAEFSIPVDGNEDCRFEFAFTGEGFADIYSLSSTKGLALSIR